MIKLTKTLFKSIRVASREEKMAEQSNDPKPKESPKGNSRLDDLVIRETKRELAWKEFQKGRALVYQVEVTDGSLLQKGKFE